MKIVIVLVIALSILLQPRPALAQSNVNIQMNPIMGSIRKFQYINFTISVTSQSTTPIPVFMFAKFDSKFRQVYVPTYNNGCSNPYYNHLECSFTVDNLHPKFLNMQFVVKGGSVGTAISTASVWSIALGLSDKRLIKSSLDIISIHRNLNQIFTKCLLTDLQKHGNIQSVRELKRICRLKE